MKDTYKNLMMQQQMSKDADAVFYEKLETVMLKKQLPVRKAAVIAACLCLLIPVTVWAAESIFGVVKVTQCQRPVSDSKPGIGMDIVYENISDHSLKDLPDHLQNLNENFDILHNSWQEAEAYLGIDLISNPVLEAEDTGKLSAWKEPGKVCCSRYFVLDGQLFYSNVYAAYQRGDLGVDVKAAVSFDHPTADKTFVQQYCHGTSITFQQFPGRPRTINTEEYCNPAGIPMLITTVSKEKPRDVFDDSYLFCQAFFAVNDVSYSVIVEKQTFDTFDLDTYQNPREKTMAALLEILDGFVVE